MVVSLRKFSKRLVLYAIVVWGFGILCGVNSKKCIGMI